MVGQIGRIRERANLLIERELPTRKIVGVVPHHGPVLVFLFRQTEPVPIKTIVEHVGRVKSTVTGILNAVARHGYVRKTPCETDRRITYVALTKKGRTLQQVFDEIPAILIERVYGDMKTSERRRLVGQLRRIEQNVRT